MVAWISVNSGSGDGLLLKAPSHRGDVFMTFNWELSTSAYEFQSMEHRQHINVKYWKRKPDDDF